MTQQQVFAVFVDVMGFADSVESLTEGGHRDLAALLTGDKPPDPDANAKALYGDYTCFQDVIRQHSRDFRGTDTASLIFSDSAFFVMPEARPLLAFAAIVTRRCLTYKIMLRCGIGYGTFERLTFTNAVDERGGLVAHAPFLGTSIVRAYRAQACECPGFRIFVHPSAVQEPHASILVPLADDETSVFASHELNYLERRGGYTPERFRELMEAWKPSAPLRAQRHYEATIRAMARLADWPEPFAW